MSLLLALMGFREELPLGYAPEVTENRRASTDEERATELALRNSIALAQFYNRPGHQKRPMDRVFSQATWLRQLELLRFRAAWRRRHPHTPLSPAA